MATFSMKIDKNNRIVLPSDLREKLGVSTGEKVYAVENETTGEVCLKTWKQIMVDIQKTVREHTSVPKGHSMVDEFIAEKREEARMENADLYS
jgi:AbrB family looped-hinge helix DNA binding protein